jgi:hypothetical protein
MLGRWVNPNGLGVAGFVRSGDIAPIPSRESAGARELKRRSASLLAPEEGCIGPRGEVLHEYYGEDSPDLFVFTVTRDATPFLAGDDRSPASCAAAHFRWEHISL